MTAFVGFIIPVDQIVHVRTTDEGQLVIEGDLKGVFGVVLAIGYFDSVQETIAGVVLMKFGDGGRRGMPLGKSLVHQL